MVQGFMPDIRLFYEPETGELVSHLSRVGQEQVVHPLEQPGAGLLDELLFEARQSTVVSPAVCENIEAYLFRPGVLFPEETFRLFHRRSFIILKCRNHGRLPRIEHLRGRLAHGKTDSM